MRLEQQMPSKSAAKPAVKTAVEAKETARPARKAAPRAGTAKHRTTKATETKPVVTESFPDDSQVVIARIAYGYWESRGQEGGDAVEDWLRAEDEYRTHRAAAAAA